MQLLIVLGAVLEGVGFALAALELAWIPKRISTYRQRDATVSPRALEITTIFPPTVTSGVPSSLEQRVDSIEARVDRARADCDAGHEELRRRIWQEADRVQRIISDQSAYVDSKLEGLIRGVAIGWVPLRWAAIALFVIGLGLSTVGAVGSG